MKVIISQLNGIKTSKFTTTLCLSYYNAHQRRVRSYRHHILKCSNLHLGIVHFLFLMSSRGSKVSTKITSPCATDSALQVETNAGSRRIGETLWNHPWLWCNRILSHYTCFMLWTTNHFISHQALTLIVSASSKACVRDHLLANSTKEVTLRALVWLFSSHN